MLPALPALIVSTLLAADAPGAGGAPAPTVQARRATEPLQIDGVPDEPAWAGAVPFESFVQLYPANGAAPSERTVVRVLYDDRNLYVSFVCHDSQPEQISRKLGLRDQPPASDTVEIVIDSVHDRRTAYLFGVNAGGVLFDSLLYDDGTSSPEWDAVWDAAVKELPDGWSAEIVIPLYVLRFSAASEQTWGILARRRLARTREELASALVPRSGAGLLSQFGDLSGLEGLKPRPNVEVTAYVASRAVLEPRFPDQSGAGPRLLNPSLDLGADLKAALGTDLTLNATVNPEFGQIEADQLILDLSNVEPFFPEKRPFFSQDMDLFQPVRSPAGFSAQQIFYSRRIGLETPILAAAKLTGSVAPGLDVGILDALVAGAAAPRGEEAELDRRWQLHLARPLHLGPNNALPSRPPVPENYFVAVTRWRPNPGASVGGRVALASPLTETCTEADAALPADQRPSSCFAFGGNAGALDWNLRTSDSTWGLLGQIVGSQTVGGPPESILRDGTRLRRGDSGLGAYLTAGKYGGEPLRFDVGYRYSSPTLELNPMGFLPTQNQHVLSANVHFIRPSGLGVFHAFDSYVAASGAWTADGLRLERNRRLALNANAVLPGFHYLELEAGYSDPRFDPREIPRSGVAFERVGFVYAGAHFETDANQLLVFSIDGAVKNYRWPRGTSGAVGWLVYTGLTFRPENRFETQLLANADVSPFGPRWVDEVEPGQFVFAPLTASSLSLTLRQLWVITPRLTMRAYVQLFTDRGAYGSFLGASSSPGEPIRLSALTPVAYEGEPDFHGAALNVNLVLRWEHRLGSSLYLVYTRAQAAPPLEEGAPVPRTLFPTGLERGAVTDGFMLKWSYLFGL
jgi:hypothetical protein